MRDSLLNVQYALMNFTVLYEKDSFLSPLIIRTGHSVFAQNTRAALFLALKDTEYAKISAPFAEAALRALGVVPCSKINPISYERKTKTSKT